MVNKSVSTPIGPALSMDQLVGKAFELERENAELRAQVERMQAVIDMQSAVVDACIKPMAFAGPLNVDGDGSPVPT